MLALSCYLVKIARRRNISVFCHNFLISDPGFGENQRTMKRPCLTER